MAPRWRIRIDGFLLAIIGAAVLASLLPARGPAVEIFAWATKIAIFVLFFLYGARLHPREALTGLTHWRLHLLILAFTYLIFPLVGVGLHSLLVPHVLSPVMFLGVLWVCLVPSTVQSSINFTSIARGNVAGAIVSASLSNIVGVVLTPVLALTLMTTSGGLRIEPGSIIDIAVQLLLPFVLGQLSRRWTAGWVSAHRTPLALVDRGSVVLVVYAAFSAGMREGIWTQVGVVDLLVIMAVCLVVLAGMLALSWWLPGRLGFSREDRIAIQFCGTKKSLATGLPMATVLFAGQPIGLIVLPLMIFHQAQLMACGALAARYARQTPSSEGS